MTTRAKTISRLWTAIGLPRCLCLFIIAWSVVALFGGLGSGDLSGYDDAVYAYEAKSMLQTGDIWTVGFNGGPDFDKPPFFIWVLAISFKLFGVSDLSAKIPAAVFGLATIILVYFVTKKLVSGEGTSAEENEWVPTLATFCMATTQYFLKYSTHAMTDVPFTFLFTLAIFFYLLASDKTIYLLASGGVIGISTLMRSPMGLFPVGIILAHLVFMRRYRAILSFPFAGLILISLAIPATWYIQEYRVFGDMFIERHFGNVLSHSAAGEARTPLRHFLWYFEYLSLIVRLYIPWFPLMFYGLYITVRRFWGVRSPISSLLVIWMLGVVVPFSVADVKVLRYILPAFPVFSIWTAFSLYRVLSPKWLPALSRFAIFTLAPAALVLVLMPGFRIRGEEMRVLAPIADAAVPPGESVVLYTSGTFEWNYRNQLLWYGNRSCTHTDNQQEVVDLLKDGGERVAIMDMPSFENIRPQLGSSVTILGASGRFVCFRIGSAGR